jgi:hypothetical protein
MEFFFGVIVLFLLMGFLVIGYVSLKNYPACKTPNNLYATPTNRIASDKRVAVLIHTFDGYRRYWSGLLFYLKKQFLHLNQECCQVYFANEEFGLELPFGMSQIKCPKGSFGDRLKFALEKIDTPYIVYIQEDMWLTSPLYQSFLQQIVGTMTNKDLLAVKLFPNCKHLLQTPEDLNDPAWYIGTHQPSMWNRQFLLETISKNNMSPFQHEVSLNRRLHANVAEGKRVLCVDDYKTDYFLGYVDVSRQGKLREIGKTMLVEAGLTYNIEEDEVMYRPAK